MLNTGYMTADISQDGDERYTPYYCVEPLLKYIPKELTIWCPFDKKWHAYVQTFLKNGYTVISSHIDDGQDFFEYEPDNYDVIISNPPFSKKDEVLKRLHELDKPYAMLLPLATLQGKTRFNYLKDGLQILAFDSRISFHNYASMDVPVKGAPFASAYFCKKILPDNLILEHLEPYDKKLKEDL